MSRKQFFVGKDGRLVWDKTLRTASWVSGKRVPFFGHGLFVEALEHGGGLYFSQDLFADLLRECAADEDIRRCWQGADARRLVDLLPEEVRLDEARFAGDTVTRGRRSVFLRPTDLPELVLKDALNRAVAGTFAKPQSRSRKLVA